MFTTSEWPQHHAQRQQPRVTTAAEARGHQRLVEMNRTVLRPTIIDTLETPDDVAL